MDVTSAAAARDAVALVSASKTNNAVATGRDVEFRSRAPRRGGAAGLLSDFT